VRKRRACGTLIPITPSRPDPPSLSSHPFVPQSEGFANTSPVLLGLADALARTAPSTAPSSIAFYQPIAGAPFPGSRPGSPPRHAAVLAAAFPQPGALTTATGLSRRAVVQALAEGRDEEVIQAAVDKFEGVLAAAGAAPLQAVVVEGAHEEAAAWAAAAAASGGGARPAPPAPPPNLPSVRLALNARLAAAMGVRVLVVVDAEGAPGGGGVLHPARPGASHTEDAAFEVATRASVCVRALRRAGAEVLGVLVNKGGGDGLAAALRPRLAAAGTRLAGVLPTDGALASPGLAELAAALGARQVGEGGRGAHAPTPPDLPVSEVLVAAGTGISLARLLAARVPRGEGQAAGGGRPGTGAAAVPPRPLVLVDGPGDRGDLVAALTSIPAVAAPVALVLCGVRARRARPPGVKVALALASNPPSWPVLTTSLSVGDAHLACARVTPSIRPGSRAKIAAAIALWRSSIPDEALQLEAASAAAPAGGSPAPTDPPARFLSRIFASAAGGGGGPAAPLARIVLPESGDARVLAAAVEVAKRRIAAPVLLGREAEVRAAAAAAGLAPGLEGVSILDPSSDPAVLAAAAARLAAARAHAGLSVPAAAALIASDPTWFGTLLVAGGQADGLVSGAAHTTADTVRPALQLLRGPREKQQQAAVAAGTPTLALPTPGLVSSLFFMCLPSGVVAFSDCALCVEPTPADLAAIALASAATAEAFGLGGSGAGSRGGGGSSAPSLPPIRVALLSYSTADSGTGPAVDRVRAAAAIAAAAAPPGVAVEGPFQYDAATCPAVAATKLSPAALAASRVAGRANVLVFPSLEAGNIAYKAAQVSEGRTRACVCAWPCLFPSPSASHTSSLSLSSKQHAQAASGAVVVGPLLQGLALGAANDLSRGCAVPDIVCTVAATVLQARALQARRRAAGLAAGAA